VTGVFRSAPGSSDAGRWTEAPAAGPESVARWLCRIRGACPAERMPRQWLGRTATSARHVPTVLRLHCSRPSRRPISDRERDPRQSCLRRTGHDGRFIRSGRWKSARYLPREGRLDENVWCGRLRPRGRELRRGSTTRRTWPESISSSFLSRGCPYPGTAHSRATQKYLVMGETDRDSRKSPRSRSPAVTVRIRWPDYEIESPKDAFRDSLSGYPQ